MLLPSRSSVPLLCDRDRARVLMARREDSDSGLSVSSSSCSSSPFSLAGGSLTSGDTTASSFTAPGIAVPSGTGQEILGTAAARGATHSSHVELVTPTDSGPEDLVPAVRITKRAPPVPFFPGAWPPRRASGRASASCSVMRGPLWEGFA
jgi:hypothetical protein